MMPVNEDSQQLDVPDDGYERCRECGSTNLTIIDGVRECHMCGLRCGGTT